MYIKLKYIQISLDMYQQISYHAESKQDEINISNMKTNQMPSRWQYLTSIKVSFSKKNLQNDTYSDTQAVIFQWELDNSKTNLDYFCL